MGKFRGRRFPPRKGGDGGGGHGGSNDTSSCRGHGAVMGTCDAARERETSKELVNLLNQAIEELYPSEDCIDDAEESTTGSSIQEMLAMELAQVRNKTHSATQNVLSINTKVKGVVLVKIMRTDLCPVKLVKAIFERVRKDKQPCCRHLVRMIPLQRVFFPEKDELSTNIRDLMETTLPGVILPQMKVSLPEDKKQTSIEGSNDHEVGEKRPAITAECGNEEEEGPNKKACVVEPVINDAENTQLLSPEKEAAEAVVVTSPPKDAATQEPLAPPATVPPPPVSQFAKFGPFVYLVLFKARSHNVLNKGVVLDTVQDNMPSFARANYRGNNAVFVVEAMRNICGATLLRPGYEDYEEFNIRKFQASHCSSVIAPAAEEEVARKKSDDSKEGEAKEPVETGDDDKSDDEDSDDKADVNSVEEENA